MSLDARLAPWSGSAYRHIPAGARYDVLDFRYAGRGADNRWNEPGEPTLYLAGDIGVAIAEIGRHFAVDNVPALAPATVTRTVYRLELIIDRLLDLRDQRAWQALSLMNAPYCFADRAVARATARYVRYTTQAQGLLAPSVAFLDQLDRWVLVLFLDKLPADPGSFIAAVEEVGPLRWGGGAVEPD